MRFLIEEHSAHIYSYYDPVSHRASRVLKYNNDLYVYMSFTNFFRSTYEIHVKEKYKDRPDIYEALTKNPKMRKAYDEEIYEAFVKDIINTSFTTIPKITTSIVKNPYKGVMREYRAIECIKDAEGYVYGNLKTILNNFKKYHAKTVIQEINLIDKFFADMPPSIKLNLYISPSYWFEASNIENSSAFVEVFESVMILFISIVYVAVSLFMLKEKYILSSAIIHGPIIYLLYTGKTYKIKTYTNDPNGPNDPTEKIEKII